MASSYEQAYISDPISRIVYNDLYQSTIYNVGAGQLFNQVISQGLVGAQEGVVIPLISQSINNISSTTQSLMVPAFQSPFDPCGGGTTSPLAQINNFNVVLAGSNVIMSNELYLYQSYGQQLYGQVQGWMNAGLSPGANSGLFSELDVFYKSVSLAGINQTNYSLDLYVFISYKVQNLNIDKISGARV